MMTSQTKARQPEPTSELSLWRQLRHTPLRDLLRGRLTSRLDYRGAICDADLPEALRDRVLQIVRRTRLWRIEKADVARELAAHFQDGIEAGAGAGELADAFGEPKSAARLIRRAKLRNRPLHWRTMRVIKRALLILLGLFAVVYIVQAIRIYSSPPNISRNFVAEWNEPVLRIPVEQRAWVLYREAGKQRHDVWEYDGDDFHPGGKKWPEVAAYVSESPDLLETIRRATQRPHLGCVVGHYEAEDLELYDYLTPAQLETVSSEENPMVMTVLLPPLRMFRSFARLLAADAHLAAEAGDGERVCDDIMGQAALADHVWEIPFLIGDLVALASAHVASQTLSSILARHPDCLSDEQIIRLSHRLSALGEEGRLAVSFDGEVASFEDVVQRCYGDDGRGDGLPASAALVTFSSISNGENFIDSVSGGGLVARMLVPAVSPFVAGRRELLEKYHSYIDQYEAEAKIPLWRRTASGAEARFLEMFTNPWDRIRYMPLSVLMPSLSGCSLRVEYATQWRDATLTAAALELYHRRHGQWPATLEELVPRYLPTVPLDRFDGTTLKYHIVDDRPLLYSIGADRDDDGGVPAEGENARRDVHRWQPPDMDKESYRYRKVPDADWILWPPLE